MELDPAPETWRFSFTNLYQDKQSDASIHFLIRKFPIQQTRRPLAIVPSLSFPHDESRSRTTCRSLLLKGSYSGALGAIWLLYWRPTTTRVDGWPPQGYYFFFLPVYADTQLPDYPINWWMSCSVFSVSDRASKVTPIDFFFHVPISYQTPKLDNFNK